MPDIKWIKITTEMFDDEKIRILEAMPEADTLIIIWIRLICIAGKINDGGLIYLSPTIPYSEENLSSVFNRPLNTVRLALATFKKLQMLEVMEDGSLFLPKFESHQNIEGMERVRKLATSRKRNQRERLKLLSGSEEPCNVTSRDCHATDKIRKDKNKEEKNSNIWNNVLINIKKSITPVNYDSWLAGANCLKIDDVELTIGVKREDQAEHIENYMKSLIENSIAHVLSEPLKLRVILIEGEGENDL